MKHFEPDRLSVQDVSALLLGGVAPRPIALVATVSAEGAVNLAPFSFFNAFGANPPMIGFSPSCRVRDGSRKDTYYNLMAVPECTVQAVTFDMVQMVNLASCEYGPEIDEFTKSGLSPIAADLVRPPRVKESPFQMECKLHQMVPLGDGKGSGNLMLCRVVKFHVAEEILGEKGIDPNRIDLVGRMGANYYTRASGEAVFEVEKPGVRLGIGYDLLPRPIRESDILTANNLAQLATIEMIPDEGQVRAFIARYEDATDGDEAEHQFLFYRHQRLGDYPGMLKAAIRAGKQHHPKARLFFEECAREALRQNDREFAWCALLYSQG
jgi:flavin reductase (DIM6/NTAB) family NADH-FMN oxidoreductase RutF